MNINSLIEKCQNFNNVVVENGIQRDIKTYRQIVRNGFKTIDNEELKLLVDKHRIMEDIG